MTELHDAQHDFVRAITGSQFHRELVGLTRERDDIRALSRLLGEELFLEWAHSLGVYGFSRLQTCAPPIPPLDLRRITGVGTSAPGFLQSGITDCKALVGHLSRWMPESSNIDVLDFGCGCGRLLRFLCQHPNFRSFGSEINADHVEWCQAALPKAEILHNRAMPPLEVDDISLDVIFAYSIFSHFDEPAALAWLVEFARVLRPNGIVVLTTHGKATLELVSMRKSLGPSAKLATEEIRQIQHQFSHKGFVFKESDEPELQTAGVGEFYGTSFVREAYIRANWQSERLELVDFVPVASNRHDIGHKQDISIFRRR